MAGLPRTACPRMRTVPFDGAMSPEMRFSMVDLPAPFGPSSPVTPGPMPHVMSETATMSPYHLATPRRTMIASSPGASPGSSGAAMAGASVTALVPGKHDETAKDDHRRGNAEGRRERHILA